MLSHHLYRFLVVVDLIRRDKGPYLRNDDSISSWSEKKGECDWFALVIVPLDDARVIVPYIFLGLGRRFFRDDWCCAIFFVCSFGPWRLIEPVLFWCPVPFRWIVTGWYWDPFPTFLIIPFCFPKPLLSFVFSFVSSLIMFGLHSQQMNMRPGSRFVDDTGLSQSWHLPWR